MTHPRPRARRAAGLAGAALVAAAATAMSGAPSAVAVDPGLQIDAAGTSVTGLANADDVARVLLAPGVALSGAATVNESSDPAVYGSQLPSFGRFTGGGPDIGIDSGLAIAANAPATSFTGSSNAETMVGALADRDDNDLGDLLVAASLCTSPLAPSCVNNATSIGFSVTPTARYLKFEYALAVTEQGGYSGGVWGGDVFDFPDGFALFVGGRTAAHNCATVPGTSTYLTMETAGIVPPTGSVGANRADAAAHLAARVADPAAPAGFAYKTEDPGWRVKFLTVPITCVVDVGAQAAAGAPVDVKVVVADSRDTQIPPAVFLKGGSVRFSANPAPTPAVDPPAPAPVAPAPVAPAPVAPAPAASPVARLLRPVSSGTNGGGATVTAPLDLPSAGRYTFIWETAAGRRVAWQPGSRLGARGLKRRYSAPVLTTAEQARRVALTTRLPRGVRAGSLRLRIVLRATDGTLSETTLTQ